MVYVWCSYNYYGKIYQNIVDELKSTSGNKGTLVTDITVLGLNTFMITYKVLA